MEIYSNASTVAVSVDYVDSHGVPIVPVSASYRVYDQDAVEIVASTAITLGTNPTKASITTDTAANTLASGVRGMRVIEVTMTNADGEIFTTTHSYVIEVAKTVVIGENSFQTYESALIIGMEMTSLSAWDGASERDKKSALSEAYTNISKLTYNDNDTLVYNLFDYTAVELSALSADFTKSIKMAQVAEANYLLGGSDGETSRNDGLMSKSVGESSQMFRPGKPITSPICKRAMKLMSGYISYGMTIGRS